MVSIPGLVIGKIRCPFNFRHDVTDTHLYEHESIYHSTIDADRSDHVRPARLCRTGS